MITLRLGHSVVAALFVVAGAVVFVASAAAAVALRSWPAGVCAVASGLLVLRLGWVLLRRRTASPDAVVVQGGPFGAAVSSPAFLTFARHVSGPWSQQGVVVLADHGGIFLPMGRRSHLLFGVVGAIFLPAVRFADVSFPVGATTPDGMADAARRHGGFVIGRDWTWNARQRWLYREKADGIVLLEHAPTSGHLRVFRPAPPPSEADLSRGVTVAALVALAVCVALVAVGAVGARWTGDPEILGGFGAFAAMLGGATVYAAVVARRRLG